MSIKIGLLNHMGGGNLGDDATQDAVMENIKSRWPDAEIFGFSMNPSDTQARHGIISYPIRTEMWIQRVNPANSVIVETRVKHALRKYRLLFQPLKKIKGLVFRLRDTQAGKIFDEFCFLAKSFRIMRSFDLLIVSGGGQLLDAWGGPWKFPYTVFKWTLLAKLSRAKCYFVNVGAGPLDHPLGKWFIKRALLLADYVSFRDGDSRALIQKIGFTGKTQVSADCVYALEASAPHTHDAAEQEEPIVGLAPMAYCDPRVYWQKDQAVYEGFVRNLASFGGWLGENRYRLALFSTDIFFDSQTIEEVRAALGTVNGHAQSRLVRCERITGVAGLLSQMNAMDYVVTCRFHGVVFAHLLNKPVLALSHHPKVFSLMNDLGLARYCLDIRNCDVNLLKDTFLSLVANSSDIRSLMAEKLACYKRSLSMQFDHLFPQGTRV